MIERILPAAVAVEEARGPLPDAVLFPEEEQEVARAVDKRREEYTTGRALARRALGRLGVAPAPIPRGEKGDPRWPDGFAGTITHCAGYRAAAVARVEDVLALGIDAEPDGPLPGGVERSVAFGAEVAMLAGLAREAPGTSWDRLLFSAKESVYKAWFPLARRWLGFEDAAVTIDRSAGTFSARLLVPGPRVAGAELRGFEGRWLAAGGLVLTAIAVPPSTP